MVEPSARNLMYLGGYWTVGRKIPRLKKPIADFHHFDKNHGNAHQHQPKRERLPDEELEKVSARKTQLSGQNDNAQRE